MLWPALCSSAGWHRFFSVEKHVFYLKVCFFGVVRGKGNRRCVNVGCVPFLTLTHYVQSADWLRAGAECFITLPLQILDAMGSVAGTELPLRFKVRPAMELACVLVLPERSFMLSVGSCSLWCQTSGVSEPSAGTESRVRIAFCGSFQLPLPSSSRAAFTPSNFCPLKLIL